MTLTLGGQKLINSDVKRMTEYIKDLIYVIQNCKMENTYKMAWIRAIVEICVLKSSVKVIHFDELAPKIFGYYWNQRFYFDLIQSPNLNKQPEIQQYVDQSIQSYRSKYGNQPVFFSRVEQKVNVPIRKISMTLKQDVCWRFLGVNTQYEFKLYKLDKDNLTIEIPNAKEVADYSSVLFDLINYRWTQKLEEFNSSPRISKKVKGIDQENVKRSPLTKFKKLLDIENPNRICFIDGKPIPDGEISIDHVIPWSFIYSDDLWNLVYVRKSYNSSKGNRLPSENAIQKLESRNRLLLENAKLLGISNTHIEQLSLAIQHNWVQRNWVNFKG